MQPCMAQSQSINWHDRDALQHLLLVVTVYSYVCISLALSCIMTPHKRKDRLGKCYMQADSIVKPTAYVRVHRTTCMASLSR